MNQNDGQNKTKADGPAETVPGDTAETSTESAAPPAYRAKNQTMTLTDRLVQIDHFQARRFSKLTGTPLEIATEGIVRHLRACFRMDVSPDHSAIREIIDDALNGRRVFAQEV